MNFSIELTALFGFGFIAVFWLAGLSFASKRNSKDIEAIQKANEDHAKETRKDMNEVKTCLGRIEGRLFGESFVCNKS
jgi:hypothetical protein